MCIHINVTMCVKLVIHLHIHTTENALGWPSAFFVGCLFIVDGLFSSSTSSSTAPAAGGPGHGARQTGDYGGVECIDRGTWTPPSATHSVYFHLFILFDFIYHSFHGSFWAGMFGLKRLWVAELDCLR